MSIFRHASLKILALAVAALLWFHVATNQAYDVEVSYHLAYVNIPEDLVLAEPPALTADVIMRGNGKALMRLMWGERRWAIDLSQARFGRQRLPIDNEDIPLYGVQGLSVIGIAGGDSLTVVLDSLDARIVPIRGAFYDGQARPVIRSGWMLSSTHARLVLVRNQNEFSIDLIEGNRG